MQDYAEYCQSFLADNVLQSLFNCYLQTLVAFVRFFPRENNLKSYLNFNKQEQVWVTDVQAILDAAGERIEPKRSSL